MHTTAVTATERAPEEVRCLSEEQVGLYVNETTSFGSKTKRITVVVETGYLHTLYYEAYSMSAYVVVFVVLF
jgi:hypothetical protein